MRTKNQRGTAVQRRPGVWRVQATGPSGEKVSRTVHARGSRPGVVPMEVQRELASLVAEVDLTRSPDEPGAPVRNMVASWFAQADLENATREGYESKIRCYIDPQLGDLDCREVTALTLAGWHQWMRDQGLGPSTIRQAHAVLRSAYKFAELHGWVDRNPASGHGPGGSGAAAQAGIESPTKEDVAALLGACETPEDRIWLLLSINLGTRRSEALALRWKDVDMAAGSITISCALDPVGARRLKSTKTHQVATLSIGAKLVAELAEYRQFLADRLGPNQDRLTGDSFIISPDLAGYRPWTPSFASHRFRYLRAKAGLADERRVQLKNLRHFHGSQLAANGVPISVIAGRLRHSTSATTQAFYLKFDKRADQAAADLFDTL